MEVAGANRRWRWPFRCRGSRRESAVAQLSTLGIMDTPPITQSKIGTKVWDFVFGIFLVGGAPLATYWLLATLTDWPCSLVYRHYGDRPAFILQMVTLT